jgi:hypothetical protein
MNVHSLSKSLSAILHQQSPPRIKAGWRLLSFKIPHLSPIPPDDATRLGPNMAPALVHQSAADWVAQQTARSKQSRSNLPAHKRQFP